MHLIQVEIPDKLADRLAPYQDHLAELLEAGLDAWNHSELALAAHEPDTIERLLAKSDKVAVPQSATTDGSYERRTPVPITGRPVSEIVIEDRGPR